MTLVKFYTYPWGLLGNTQQAGPPCLWVKEGVLKERLIRTSGCWPGDKMRRLASGEEQPGTLLELIERQRPERSAVVGG